MKYCKVRKVKNPNRANSTDAGIDFYVPENITVEDLKDKSKEDCVPSFMNGYLDEILLSPGGRVLIPSGVHVRLDPGTALILMNKSGVAAKKGLVIGSCVVDESYTGEIHLSLINTSSHIVTINAGDKIAQGLIFDVRQSVPCEIDSIDELYDGFKSERGDGGFGSSGEK